MSSGKAGVGVRGGFLGMIAMRHVRGKCLVSLVGTQLLLLGRHQ